MTITKAGPDQLVLGFGPGWRWFFGALGALMAYAMIQERQLGAFALVVSGVSFFAAFYFQRWEFDRQSDSIAHRSGFLFVHRTKLYSLTDLQEVLVHGRVPADREARVRESQVRRRQVRTPEGGFTRLWLRFAKAGDVEIQMESYRNAATLRDLGVEIARFCAVPYREEGQT